jgi:hypothetical protein
LPVTTFASPSELVFIGTPINKIEISESEVTEGELTQSQAIKFQVIKKSEMVNITRLLVEIEN